MTDLTKIKKDAIKEFVDYCKTGIDKAFSEKSYPTLEVKVWSKEIAEAVKVFMIDVMDFYLSSQSGEGCENCNRRLPNGYIEVTDIKNPYCAKCGRNLKDILLAEKDTE